MLLMNYKNYGFLFLYPQFLQSHNGVFHYQHQNKTHQNLLLNFHVDYVIQLRIRK